MVRPVVTRRLFVAGLTSAAVVPAACRGDDRPRTAASSSTTSPPATTPLVPLPPPRDGSVSLSDVLRRRRSVRTFAPDALTDAELGQLLWAAQGITADWGGRTAPSAGGLYPVELYAVTAARAAHYLPAGHQLDAVTQRDVRAELRAAALDQAPIGEAPVTIAVTVVPARSSGKYGERAGRYVDLEAGHAAQNVLLQAAALDLGAVPIGAFDDTAVARTLDLPGGCEPRYLLAVGHPRT